VREDELENLRKTVTNINPLRQKHLQDVDMVGNAENFSLHLIILIFTEKYAKM
jgi:hypothetical protein